MISGSGGIELLALDLRQSEGLGDGCAPMQRHLILAVEDEIEPGLGDFDAGCLADSAPASALPKALAGDDPLQQLAIAVGWL